MNIKDKQVIRVYGEPLNRGKGLFLLKGGRNLVVPTYGKGFKMNISTSIKLYVIESEFVEYSVFSTPVLIDSEGNITFREKVSHLKSLTDLDGVNDGTSSIEINGDNLCTSKAGTFIGKNGENVKLLSKYLGKIKIKSKKG